VAQIVVGEAGPGCEDAAGGFALLQGLGRFAENDCGSVELGDVVLVPAGMFVVRRWVRGMPFTVRAFALCDESIPV